LSFIKGHSLFYIPFTKPIMLPHVERIYTEHYLNAEGSERLTSSLM
jgi:hypothetical protein